MVDDLTRREVKLSIGGSVHDPTDPVGRLLFNLLAMVAEFEADLVRSRTHERDAGRESGRSAPDKQPKLSKAQEKHLVEVYQRGGKFGLMVQAVRGEHTTAQIAELFSVARSTLYRAIQRAGDTAVLACYLTLEGGATEDGVAVRRITLPRRPPFPMLCVTKQRSTTGKRRP
ncbi:recombinase family protein (plasmid) [Pseudarthrobacter sp. P1]|uniref:recombinase family protein n=1 Tax=Pseudarthrobacter sp. P1 TaxID=3418418 RepID=UPI003CF4B22E